MPLTPDTGFVGDDGKVWQVFDQSLHGREVAMEPLIPTDEIEEPIDEEERDD